MQHMSEKIDDKRPFEGLLPRTRRRLMLRTLAVLVFLAVSYGITDMLTTSGI